MDLVSVFPMPPQGPVAFSHTLETLHALAEKCMDESDQRLSKMMASTSPVQAAEKAEDFTSFGLVLNANETLSTQCLVGFYQYVSPSENLRHASSECTKLFSVHTSNSTRRRDVWEYVNTIWELRKDQPWRTIEGRKWLHKYHKSFVNGGLGIPEGSVKRTRLEEVTQRIATLNVELTRNMANAGGVWLSISELQGVPPAIMARLKRSDPGDDVWLTFKKKDVEPVLKFCEIEETRKQMFCGNEAKSVENVLLFHELVTLRAESAALLGYSSYMEQELANGERMMTFQEVKDFLADLEKEMGVLREGELEKLRSAKKRHLAARGVKTNEADKQIYLWDEEFYKLKIKETEHDLDEAAIAEFFPLVTTIAGLLDLISQLFGTMFVELSTESRKAFMEEQDAKLEDALWHEDVRLFCSMDKPADNPVEIGNKFLGYLYLDLIARDGKQSRAFNIIVQPVRKIVIQVYSKLTDLGLYICKNSISLYSPCGIFSSPTG
jgi:metallopeptidase MepB